MVTSTRTACSRHRDKCPVGVDRQKEVNMTIRDVLVLLIQLILPTVVLYAASSLWGGNPLTTNQIVMWWPCTLLMYGSMVAAFGFIVMVRKRPFRHLMVNPWPRTILATIGGTISGYLIVGPTLMLVAGICSGTTILVSCETPAEIF